MDRKTLHIVQRYMLEIAKEIKRVCDENGIHYFLDSGSLLGAVRHHGFIPWDDDMDIGMLRDDYERFLNIAPEKLDDHFLLQTWDNDPGYGLPYAKVQLKNTIYLENNAENVNCNHGIFVDVFPYDNFPDKPDKKQGKALYFYQILMKAKCKYKPWKQYEKTNIKKYVGYIPVRFIALFVSKKNLIQKYDVLAEKYNYQPTKNKYSQGASHYEEWVMPSKVLENLTSIPFENIQFSVPEDYDTYLTQVYGDYLKLPPEDQRENRHGIIRLDYSAVKNSINIGD